MEKVRNMLKIAPEDYKIKRLESNLMAKFNFEDKTIIINPDIVKYSIEEIEYMVFHQFCHLKYKTHCQAFKELIKKYNPNYKKFDIQLNNIKF